MGYSSAFDDLLAQGRRELDQMTGRAPTRREEPAPAAPVRDRSHTIEGTTRGIPFRLRLKPPKGGAR